MTPCIWWTPLPPQNAAQRAAHDRAADRIAHGAGDLLADVAGDLAGDAADHRTRHLARVGLTDREPLLTRTIGPEDAAEFLAESAEQATARRLLLVGRIIVTPRLLRIAAARGRLLVAVRAVTPVLLPLVAVWALAPIIVLLARRARGLVTIVIARLARPRVVPFPLLLVTTVAPARRVLFLIARIARIAPLVLLIPSRCRWQRTWRPRRGRLPAGRGPLLQLLIGGFV